MNMNKFLIEQLDLKNEKKVIAGYDTSLLLDGISFDVPAPLLSIGEGRK